MLKILSGHDIKNLDRYTIEKQNITSLKLMDRAVNVFLNWYTSNYSSKESINIFCGVGNNGGDGLQAACILKEKGYKVEIYIVGDSKRFTKECLYHLKNAKNKKIKIVSITNESQSQISKSDIIIDAIFGSGLSRKLDTLTSKLVDYINSSKSKIISIDIPTGIPANSYIKSNFIRSDFTLTFQLPKLSFYMPEYSNYIGKIIVLDIGLEKTFIENADGIASVMGHEIAHAVARHSAERASTAMVTDLGIMALEQLVLGQRLPQAAGYVRQFGLDLPFNRRQESEADYLGLIFSSLAGYDINESYKVWERMKEDMGGSGPSEFFSTHPSPDNRIKKLK